MLKTDGFLPSHQTFILPFPRKLFTIMIIPHFLSQEMRINITPSCSHRKWNVLIHVWAWLYLLNKVVKWSALDKSLNLASFLLYIFVHQLKYNCAQSIVWIVAYFIFVASVHNITSIPYNPPNMKLRRKKLILLNKFMQYLFMLQS